MTRLALFLCILFAALPVFSAAGLDLGCSDDCERGLPCATACAACLCHPVVPSAELTSGRCALVPLAAAAQLDFATPLPGVRSAVLHVPLAA